MCHRAGVVRAEAAIRNGLRRRCDDPRLPSPPLRPPVPVRSPVDVASEPTPARPRRRCAPADKSGPCGAERSALSAFAAAPATTPGSRAPANCHEARLVQSRQPPWAPSGIRTRFGPRFRPKRCPPSAHRSPAGGATRRDRGRGGGIRTHDLVLPKHVRCRCATPRRIRAREAHGLRGLPQETSLHRFSVAASAPGVATGWSKSRPACLRP